MRRAALRALLALAALLTIAGAASAWTDEPGLHTAGAHGRAGAVSTVTLACDASSPGAAEIAPDADADDFEPSPVRAARPVAGSGRSDRVSYRPARAPAAMLLAVGSPLRPPRGSA